MKHKKHDKRYNDDFRKMVVDLYHSGQSVRNLSMNMAFPKFQFMLGLKSSVQLS